MNKAYVLDSCVWIAGLMKVDESCQNLLEKIKNGKIEVHVNTYIALEVVRNIRKEALTCGLNPDKIESRFWIICSSNSIKLYFDQYEFANKTIEEIKQAYAHKALAKALDIEIKDSPIVAFAYAINALLVTIDERSLLKDEIKKRVEDRIGLKIIHPKEL